ncbi:hypothetical protein DSO57_1001816 [Entomophthora muscae]|uniref:Uncharacterized protein n=1 Tax=Entomophthora muscae TaxID=34485 RepID=A0ACC2U6U8_9FUNG|nr:hypothetical protein DSO57_1001816 [Entomophthora muscae]
MSSNQPPPTPSKPPSQACLSTPAVMEAPPCGGHHAYGVDGCGKKRVSTLPIFTGVKHPQLFSPVIEKAKHFLSYCTPADPKRICVAEPSPTCTPSPSHCTKSGICREDAPSFKDVDKSNKRLKIFKDAIQTLLDKFSALSEELGDKQQQENKAEIGKHAEEAMAKIPNLDQTSEEVMKEGEDILSQENQLDIEFEEDELKPTQ